MALLTKQDIFQISKAFLEENSTTLSKVLDSIRTEKKSAGVTIFLSHSHLDTNVVKEMLVLFKKMNANLYIDWMDDLMPEKTSGTTAASLKEKIRDNDKFILLATNSALSSKWCNWELGFGDSLKLSSDKLMIFPIAENGGGWIGNEYLNLYPRVESSTLKGFYKVYYPDGTSTWLDDWVKK